MSADNGIYILSTTDKYKSYVNSNGVICTDYLPEGIKAYRVAHVQGVDDLDYYLQKEIHNLGYFLLRNWSLSRVYYSLDEAHMDATQLYFELREDIPIEYGIQEISLENYNFPGF